MTEAAIQLVPAVDRAIRMLSSLELTDDGKRISDLARDLQIPKSSAFQIAVTLVHHGVLECDEQTRRYRLGPKLRSIAARQQGRADLPLLAARHLRSVADDTGLTALLGLPTPTGTLLVAKADSPEALGIAAPIGYELELWAGAFGKIFAAALPAPERKVRMQKGLPAYTARSIVRRADMEQELRRVATQGIAVDTEEYIDGIRAVAAPVHDMSGVVAAVCVLGVGPQMKRDRLVDICTAVKGAAAALSAELDGGSES